MQLVDRSLWRAVAASVTSGWAGSDYRSGVGAKVASYGRLEINSPIGLIADGRGAVGTRLNIPLRLQYAAMLSCRDDCSTVQTAPGMEPEDRRGYS